jgi:hypothetical protein
MLDSFLSFYDKLKLAVTGIFYVIKKIKYMIVAAVIALLFCILLTLFSSGTFYISLLVSGLPIYDKFLIFGTIIEHIALDSTTFSGIIIILISLLQGISITMLIYNFRHQRSTNKTEHIRNSTTSTVFAMIGLGCPTCGTSLIMPIAGIFFSGSSSLLAANIMSSAFVVLALIICIYTSLKLGYISYINYTSERYLKNKDNKNEL